MEKKPLIYSSCHIAEGKWLYLQNICYKDATGQKREWESVERKGGKNAVALIPILKPSKRLVLVRQYRPPAKGYVIEFPAGLIDEGEMVESAAIRELSEETGYSGKIIKMFPPSFNSPGLSGETASVFLTEINEDDVDSRDLTAKLDEGEDIETILVPVDGLLEFLKKAHESGDFLDAKLISFAIGYRTALL